jgi:dihydroflavonol-4-reductase
VATVRRTTVRDPSLGDAFRAALDTQVEIGESMSVFTADLNADKGWDDAVAGCDSVLRVASPFPAVQPSERPPRLR